MENEKKQNYLRGASILAATVVITKIIGAVYKMPLLNLLGDEGSAHFQVTYTVYNLLLTLSTAGIPVAMSRLISSSRAMGRTAQVRRYYRVGMASFGAVGLLGAVCMFVFAPELAAFMGDGEITDGVRTLAPAVFFACLVSVYRGYSQGHGEMLPTAVSQIMEVSCKLVFGLAAAWYLSRRGASSADVAAGAIVGVTVGLGLAVPVLASMRRKLAKRADAAAGPAADVPAGRLETFCGIMRIGIPIMLGSSILNIITLIDSKLVLQRLQSGAGFSYTDAKVLLGVYSKALTFFNIPSAFITPVAVSVVPAIAAAIARRRSGEARGVMESCMKLTNLLALPAGAGMAVLAEPIFRVIYPGSNSNGPHLLAVLGAASFLVCTYIITSAVLQASGFEKLSLVALPAGGMVKIAVNWVLVGRPEVNIMGAPVGTLACYGVITLINVVFMAWKLPERPNIIRALLRPAGCTAGMAVCAWGLWELASAVILPAMGGGRAAAAICLAADVVISAAAYAALALASKTVTREDVLLLPKGAKIAEKFKIR